MTTFLPKEVAEGLEAARKQALRKKSRLRVQAGTEIFTVLKYWDSGFSVDCKMRRSCAVSWTSTTAAAICINV